MDKLKTIFKFGDFVVAVLITLLAAGILCGFFWYGRDGGQYAVVYLENKEILKVSLAANKTYELKGKYPATVTIQDGKARFLSAGCPDQVCVVTGWISRKGQTSVCVPNRMVLKISGGAENDIDIIVD